MPSIVQLYVISRHSTVTTDDEHTCVSSFSVVVDKDPNSGEDRAEHEDRNKKYNPDCHCLGGLGISRVVQWNRIAGD